MLGKITKTSVERLEPGGEWLWDSVVKGFGARRQTDGVFYYVRYRLNGRQHIKSLGRHGSPLTPDIGRNAAKTKLGIAAAGTDPFAQPLAAETFAREVTRYLERKQATLKPRSYVEVQRHLLNHAKPLHRLRLGEIDRRTIAALLAEVEEGGPYARNRVRSSLSAFFAWAIREGFIEVNPVAGTGKAEQNGARERVLTEAEFREIWSTLPRQGQFGDIVRLLVLTGQRRLEISALRWSEVDFERRLIAFPPARTKNKRLHELPLSLQAQAILKRQPKRKDRDLIFGLGNGGFSGFSEGKKTLDKTIHAKHRRKPMPHWRIHDLRRTAATGMAELGVQPHIIEAVLNHVSGHKGGVAGIYNRARYADAMRDALQRWADHLEQITKS
jgi:integrase